MNLGGATVRPGSESPPLHRPAAGCGLSVLERPPGLSHWPAHLCPFRRAAAATEASSLGSYYYKDFFYGRGEQADSWMVLWWGGVGSDLMVVYG